MHRHQYANARDERSAAPEPARAAPLGGRTPYTADGGRQ